MIMRSYFRPILGGLAAGVILPTLPMLAGAAQAQTKKRHQAQPLTQPRAQTAAEQTSSDDTKPNILFIMGDDIGWMQPGIHHEGLGAGETPNIDRIGHEGAKYMEYYAMQSCTSGRNAFVTGMYPPLRTGMIEPQLPGSPSYLLPGTPSIGKFLLDLGYTTGEFGKNHLGDHTASLPTAHGFQEFWGYLYHLNAMQGVSFPDIAAHGHGRAFFKRDGVGSSSAWTAAPNENRPCSRCALFVPTASPLATMCSRSGTILRRGPSLPLKVPKRVHFH
jgi:Sulfatase